MKRRRYAAARLGAPIDTCKQCEASFVCQELGPIEPLDWGIFAEERKRRHREMIHNGDPVRFLVRELPQQPPRAGSGVPDENGKDSVQFHGPFCSEDCARAWMEPRRDAIQRVRPTRWQVFIAQWGGPLAGHSEVDGQIDARKVRAGQVWLPIGGI